MLMHIPLNFRRRLLISYIPTPCCFGQRVGFLFLNLSLKSMPFELILLFHIHNFLSCSKSIMETFFFFFRIGFRSINRGWLIWFMCSDIRWLSVVPPENWIRYFPNTSLEEAPYRYSPNNLVQREWKRQKTFIYFIYLFSLFRSSFIKNGVCCWQKTKHHPPWFFINIFLPSLFISTRLTVCVKTKAILIPISKEQI